MKTSRLLVLSLLSSMLCMGNAMASGSWFIQAVTVENVSVIQLATSGHLPGNLEIKVKDGFTLPAGASCTDRVYLTTLKSVDADKRMMALLLAAQTTKQQVALIITDDPAYTAFAGRCSIAAVTLTQTP
jgi:hypothetical protein